MNREVIRAYRELARREPVFARLLDVYEPPDPFAFHDGGRTGGSRFAALVLHIAGQRISASVSFAVFDRIVDAGGGIPTPEEVLRLGSERLRSCGISRSKADYIVDLAAHEASGELDLAHIDALPDEDVVAQLIRVAGIGRWTAEIFLIHQLKRPDVLPAGDPGIRSAIHQLWSLDAAPTAGDVKQRAISWAPYRTYAAKLLWRSRRPAGEPFDQKERALAATR